MSRRTAEFKCEQLHEKMGALVAAELQRTADRWAQRFPGLSLQGFERMGLCSWDIVIKGRTLTVMPNDVYWQIGAMASHAGTPLTADLEDALRWYANIAETYRLPCVLHGIAPRRTEQ